MGLKCEGSTIESIEKEQNKRGIRLPKAYKDFLRVCGEGAAQLFCGDVIELRHLDYINDSGRETYEAAFGQKCPSNIFFILEHHGYSYCYFKLNDGDNPDLYLLVYGDEVTNELFGKIDHLLDYKIGLLKK
ncbi:SMI1-KNR4 cell-wall [Pontibacter lucknowensis]|uniref:SMI1-KNR4 cell-wall n=2 Tax=Pontibacter lucknowensis TaxID=1077936 RepID=A0A1N6WRA9_9BACT|nr:SMI1-KNR4 cell-wall [Pontibacter lucknowensis]